MNQNFGGIGSCTVRPVARPASGQKYATLDHRLRRSFPNQRWSLDFVADTFGVSGKLWILVLVDDCCSENLGLVANISISDTKGPREREGVVI